MGLTSLVELRQTFLDTSILQSLENHLLPLTALILAERDEHIRVPLVGTSGVVVSDLSLQLL